MSKKKRNQYQGNYKKAQIKRKPLQVANILPREANNIAYDPNAYAGQVHFNGSTATVFTIAALLVFAQVAAAHENYNNNHLSHKESGTGLKNVEASFSGGFALKAAEIGSLSFESEMNNATNYYQGSETLLGNVTNATINRVSSIQNATIHVEHLDKYSIRSGDSKKKSTPPIKHRFFATNVKHATVLGDKNELMDTSITADTFGTIVKQNSVAGTSEQLSTTAQDEALINVSMNENPRLPTLPDKKLGDDIQHQKYSVFFIGEVEANDKGLKLFHTILKDKISSCFKTANLGCNIESYGTDCNGVANGWAGNSIKIAECGHDVNFFKSNSMDSQRYRRWQQICTDVINESGGEIGFASGTLHNFLFGDPSRLRQEIGVLDSIPVYILNPIHLSLPQREARILSAIPSSCDNESNEIMVKGIPWNRVIVDLMHDRLERNILPAINADRLTHPDYTKEEFLQLTGRLETALSYALEQTYDPIHHTGDYEYTDTVNTEIAKQYADFFSPSANQPGI